MCLLKSISGNSSETVASAVGILGFHRAKFLETLEKSLDPRTCKVYFSRRLVSYRSHASPETGHSVVMVFEDGTSATADVLIGCDGINSAVRHQMIKNLGATLKESGNNVMAETVLRTDSPIWSGSYAYRGVFPCSKLAEKNPRHNALSKAVNVRNAFTTVLFLRLTNATG